MDTDTHENPKILDFIEEHGQRALAAIAVWKFAIGYAGGHGTDGEITRAALKQVHGTPAHARLLVEAGFFELTEKGWQIAGYETHQPSRAMTDQLREQLSEAGKKGAAARWGKES
ncbi:hypothetical protein [Microbacterium maritypicum]|nr:hypothetical protein [Microbacterium liquefaciens]